MRTDDFDYELPNELIAQEPSPRREDARMLVLSRADGAVTHRRIPDLADLLREGDLLVVNDTRVLRARIAARRATGGKVEVFLLHPAPAAAGSHGMSWEALVRAGGSIAEGESLSIPSAPDLQVRLVARLGGGHWQVEAEGADGHALDMSELMTRAGRMPLPPYIRRGEGASADGAPAADPRAVLDETRYQTVYARNDGAVAAPTAGLHLTEDLLARLAAKGVASAAVTLHVGLGTFKPVETEQIEDHRMHEEPWTIPSSTALAVRAAKARGGRVVAVGTTSVRALESAAAESADGLPSSGSGSTRLFLAPGSPFRVVDALLTNFHLPRSTLLCLVSAFAGRDAVLSAYREAVRERYRFFSYGDAMFLA